METTENTKDSSNLPQNPQLLANYILNKMYKFSEIAEDLCKNREIRLEERLQLVDKFGISTSQRPLTFKYFKYDDDELFSSNINKIFNRYIQNDLSSFIGSTMEVSQMYGENFHLFLYGKLQESLGTSADHQEILDASINAELKLVNAVAEEYLQQFVGYIYETED